MTNTEIARLLSNVASAYSITDEKKYRFQVLAYKKAADTIGATLSELKELYKEGKLDELPGVGTSIKSHLEELFTKGRVEYFDEVLMKVPHAVFPLLDVTGIGPKKAYKLVNKFGLTNPNTVIKDLIKLGETGKIATLDSFGAKSEQDILQAFKEYGQGSTKLNRMVLPYANDELAKK